MKLKVCSKASDVRCAICHDTDGEMGECEDCGSLAHEICGSESCPTIGCGGRFSKANDHQPEFTIHISASGDIIVPKNAIVKINGSEDNIFSCLKEMKLQSYIIAGKPIYKSYENQLILLFLLENILVIILVFSFR